jgi:hypothetical protein
MGVFAKFAANPERTRGRRLEAQRARPTSRLKEPRPLNTAAEGTWMELNGTWNWTGTGSSR